MNSLNMVVSHEELKPKVGTAGSAGYDLRLAQDVVLAPGNKVLVGTGVKVEIPFGYVGLVAPRSSCGDLDIMLANTLGFIDSDYRGEILLKLKNLGNETFLGYRTDRIVQLVVVPVLMLPINYKKELSKTERGDKGFGSTGRD